MATKIDEKVWGEKINNYLVELDTVRRYIEEVLGESIGSLIDFQASLCNGVYLARLAKVLAPSKGRIYDSKQEIFSQRGLQYKHMENVNIFLSMLRRKKLPTVFHPDAGDIFEKKNIPKVIYCLKALMDYDTTNSIEEVTADIKFSDDVINSTTQSLQVPNGTLERAFEQLDIVQSSYKGHTSSLMNNSSDTNQSALVLSKHVPHTSSNGPLIHELELKQIIKMQAIFRGAVVRLRMRQFRTLPTFSAVKMFSRILQFSLGAYEKECHLQAVKGCIISDLEHGATIRMELEKRDIQIKLIIQKKISAEKILKGKPKQRRVFESPPQKPMNGKNRMTLNTLENLMYTLKTDREYLGQVFFTAKGAKDKNILQELTFAIHNYGLAPREEYYALKLFHLVVYKEIMCMNSVSDFDNNNSVTLNIVVAYMKHPTKTQSFREVIGDTVHKIIAEEPLHLLPLDIFEHYKLELKSKSNPHTQEEALKIDFVRKKLAKNISKVERYVLAFIEALNTRLDKLSYSIRFLFGIFYKALRQKFEMNPITLIKTVGRYFFCYLLSPILISPELYGILRFSMKNEITLPQRQNLARIAKMLQNTAMGSGYTEDFLSPLNDFINQNSLRMGKVLVRMCNTPRLDHHFLVAECITDKLVCHPDIIISVEIEKIGLHLSPEDFLTKEPLFQALGVRSVGQQFKIACVNHNSGPAILIGHDKMQDLFLRAKELCVYLLPYLKGHTLPGALLIDSSPEQMDSFKLDAFLKKEGIQTLPQAKRRLKNMLNTLEKEGYVTKDDGYQALLQAICKDVIYRKKFREFQERELKTVTRTRDIIGQQTNDLQKQLEIYDKYLDSCVMASKSPFH